MGSWGRSGSRWRGLRGVTVVTLAALVGMSAAQGGTVASRELGGTAGASLDAPGDGVPAPGKGSGPTAASGKMLESLTGKLGVDDGLAARVGSGILARVGAEETSTLRGVKEARIYQKASPSVVLVLTRNGLGSGFLISRDGMIITNFHVVAEGGGVGVVFKPEREGARIGETDVRRAEVLAVDRTRDLALLQVSDVPPGREPIRPGNMDSLTVGADVHAIGHPTGEAWTYTKGVVSQIRRGYQWGVKGGVKEGGKTPGKTQVFRADVIQTQTPINPGNSGGPLLNDEGDLVGVNSFKAGGEGLNFAVTVDEVRVFVQDYRDRLEASTRERPVATPATSVTSKPAASKRNPGCEDKVLYEGPNEAGTGNVLRMDRNCDGRADAVAVFPYDKSKPFITDMDLNFDGRVDLRLVDEDRNGYPEYGFFDTDFNGTWDSIGYFRQGELKPYRYEPYTR